MKYERITNRETAYDFMSDSWQTVEQEAYIRLTELEDKIEAGTLIELRCQFGDKVYGVDKFIGKIVYGQLTKIELDFFGFTYTVFDNGHCRYLEVREIFLTKEEAEERLRR